MIDKLVFLILAALPAALREVGAAAWLADGIARIAGAAAPVLTRLVREQIAGGALPDLVVPREPGDWRIVDEEIARALAADTVPPEAPPTEPQGEP